LLTQLGNNLSKSSSYLVTLPKQSIEEKESFRWPDRAIAAAGNLTGVKKVTVIQDREGDIYESFCLLREREIDFVIRVNYDRRLENNEEAKSPNDAIKGFPAAFEYETEVEGEKRRRKKRTARLEVRYGGITVRRPRNIFGKEKYPGELTLTVVYVKEKEDSVPPGEEAIEWKLYTAHIVNDTESALLITGYYKCRRMTGDLFRTVKTEGLNYEEGELESGKALRKLPVMALMAAAQILKLRQAREGTTKQKTSSVFSKTAIKCMKDLMPRFGGNDVSGEKPKKAKTRILKTIWRGHAIYGAVACRPTWRLERFHQSEAARSHYTLRGLEPVFQSVRRLRLR
jgi:hypothetical protein